MKQILVHPISDPTFDIFNTQIKPIRSKKTPAFRI